MAPAGRVRLGTGEVGVPVEGRLVDVGARGLRMACASRCPGAGSRVRLEIVLDDPDRPQGPPRLVLDGTGEVVWMRRFEGDQVHAGVAFDRPVDVRRSFPEVVVF